MESDGETRWSNAWGWAVSVAVFALILLALFLAVKQFMDDYRQPTLAKWQTLHVGMSADDVQRNLGAPRFEYQASNAPEDYYVPGYGRKERDISNRVLIYLERDLVLYVYIGTDGNVEETVIAPS